MNYETLEGRVLAHRLASERRSANKPIWDFSVDIKAVIHRDQENTYPNYVIDMGKEISEKLRGELPKTWFDSDNADYDSDIAYIASEFSALTDYSDYGVLNVLNSVLRDLYYWADVKRVWLGS